MKTPLNPYSTLEVADPLENLRVRLTLWLFPVGAVAAFLAWTLSLQSGELSPPDRYLLWPIMLGFLALEVYLFLYPKQIRLVWYIALGLIALYEIVQVFYEAAYGLEQHQYISPALLWFPMVYLMAFVSLGRRQAFMFSLVYLLLGLGVGVVGLIVGGQALHPAASNSAIQFALSNTTYVLLMYLFAQLRRYYAQMHQMAYSDPLTTLLNRRGIQNALEVELERMRGSTVYGRRSQDSTRPTNSTVRKSQVNTFSVLIIDLDHFKQINDTHGHAVGDQVLRETALRLKTHLRDSDRLGRWGGEEFLVLAPETDLQRAFTLAQRLHEDIRSHPVTGIGLTMSLGVAAYHPEDSMATLLARADEALYRAKAAGRDRIVREDEPEEPILPAHNV